MILVLLIFLPNLHVISGAFFSPLKAKIQYKNYMVIPLTFIKILWDDFKKIKQPKNGLFKIMSKMPVNSTHSSPLEITKKSFKLMVIQTEKIY